MTEHEFATIDHVKEDMLEIIMNLKKLRIKIFLKMKAKLLNLNLNQKVKVKLLQKILQKTAK